MKKETCAKIGYLVDQNKGWDDEPDWKLYEENEVPRHYLESEKTKRIVYFEL